MNNTTAFDLTHPPHIDELSPAERTQLQHETAKKLGYEISFRDQIAQGHDAPSLSIIPAGCFEMGSDSSEFGHRHEESPRHLMTISQPFAIGQLPVLAHEFEQFRQTTQWTLRQDLIWNEDRYPVINIRSADVKLYLAWLSEETGQQYRLPTEAEWEYAARAGTQTPFYFGESVTCKEVHFNAAFPYEEAKQKKRWFLPRCIPTTKASPAGLREPNLWNLYDMHGNVWEFTSSHWAQSHLGNNRDGSANQVTNPDWYVTKGGSWFDGAVLARSAARKKRHFDELDTNLGFRVVREL